MTRTSRRRILPSLALVAALVGGSVAVGALAASAYTPDAPVITSVGYSVADNTPILIQGNAENSNGQNQTIEVRVARRDIAEQVGHADHRPFKVFVEKPDGPEHGAVRRTAHAGGGQEGSTWHCGFYRGESSK